MAFLGCTIRNKCAGLFSHTIVPSRGTGWCWGSWATVLAKLSQACVLANYASHDSGFVAGQWSVRELPSYARHTAKGDRVRASRARGGAAGGVVSPRPCGSKAERLSFFSRFSWWHYQGLRKWKFALQGGEVGERERENSPGMRTSVCGQQGASDCLGRCGTHPTDVPPSALLAGHCLTSRPGVVTRVGRKTTELWSDLSFGIPRLLHGSSLHQGRLCGLSLGWDDHRSLRFSKNTKRNFGFEPSGG